MTEREGQDEGVLGVRGDMGTTTRDMRLSNCVGGGDSKGSCL